MAQLIQTHWRESEQIFEVELSDPPANVLSAAMMGAISQDLERVSRQKSLKAIVFSHQGPNFSYGASVEEHQPGQVEQMLPQFHLFIDQILALPVASFARVSGFCLGGAFELLMALDCIFCDETARFALPEIQLGVFPPVACALLPRLMAPQAASRMILTGQRLKAEDMKSLGFVSEVFTSAKLKAGVDEFLTSHILPRSAESLRQAHLALRQDLLKSYRAQIGDLERRYLKDLMSTQDAREGIQSFLEKRAPIWKNN